MYIQLIWKRLVTNGVPLSVRRLNLASSMVPPPAFYATPHKNFAKFCTDIAVPSTNPDWGFDREFLINRCGLTDEEITNAFRHCNEDLPGNLSTQNMEEVFELLNGCGLTTPAQIRKVVVRNPRFLFYKPESFKIKLSFFRTFMETKDIAKLIYIGAKAFNSSESRHKSAVLVLQKLGIEGQALSYLLVTQPRLLTTPEEQVMESFKKAEDLGFKKGSRTFAVAMGAIIASGQETIDRSRQCLSNLGFSENQISEIWRRKPSTIGLTEEKLKSLSFFRTFMETEDIAKLIYIGANVFNSNESRHKSAVLVLQKLGIEGEALSYFLVTQPRLLTTPEEQVMESFKKAEDLGFKKGSRIFAIAVGTIIALGQETIDRRRQCLSNLGFSENQISEIWRTKPSTIGLTEEKLKRNVEFLVKITGLSCSDIVRFPILLAHSVEAKMIPRCRVMEALKSMQVQVPKENQLSSLYIFLLSEKRFLERYINSNAEFSSRLLDIYHGGRESLKADH